MAISQGSAHEQQLKRVVLSMAQCAIVDRPCAGTPRGAGHGGAYVNFMTEEEQGRVRSAYGSNYDRLANLKKEYDPNNIFRLNQNIQPAA